MKLLFLWIAQRIRIPVPLEIALPIAVIGYLVLFVFTVHSTRNLWRKWGLVAVLVLVSHNILFDLLRSVQGGTLLLGRYSLSLAVTHLILVWAAILTWHLLGKVSVKGALIAAAAYSVLGSLAFSLVSFGSFSYLDFLSFISYFLTGALLLGGFSLGLTKRGTIRHAVAGAAVGFTVASLLNYILAGQFGINTMVYPLISGALIYGLGIAASTIFKLEQGLAPAAKTR